MTTKGVRPPRHKMDLTGQVFARWMVISHVPKGSPYQYYWFCRCECGYEKEVHRSSLINGQSTGCGRGPCHTQYVHGQLFGGHKTPEYWAWANMKARCYRRSHKAFANYGGRGITVCDHWRESFMSFLEDMGFKPSPDLSLDRINNDGNYEPGNCRWATAKQQTANRRTPKKRSASYTNKEKVA